MIKNLKNTDHPVPPRPPVSKPRTNRRKRKWRKPEKIFVTILAVLFIIFTVGSIAGLGSLKAKPPVPAVTSVIQVTKDEAANDYYVKGIVLASQPVPEDQRKLWQGLVDSPKALDRVVEKITASGTKMTADEVRQAIIESAQSGTLNLHE